MISFEEPQAHHETLDKDLGLRPGAGLGASDHTSHLLGHIGHIGWPLSGTEFVN